MKNKLIYLLCFFTVTFSNILLAIDPIYNTGSEKLAIKGYDVVAYFTENTPKKGKTEFSYPHLGVKWQFSSKENMQYFIDDPEKFMPQYGGYCAYAVSKKTTASIKPEVFKIYNDKLYLNYSSGVQRRWLKRKDKYIGKADKNWVNLRDK